MGYVRLKTLFKHLRISTKDVAKDTGINLNKLYDSMLNTNYSGKKVTLTNEEQKLIYDKYFKGKTHLTIEEVFQQYEYTGNELDTVYKIETRNKRRY